MNDRPDHLRLFDEKTIQVRTLDGIKLIKADIIGCWAVHSIVSERPGRAFMLTHVPPGVALPTTFLSQKDACNAAIEIHRLRNDWPIFTWSDFEEKKIGAQLGEIIKKNNGRPLLTIRSPADATSTNDLNGYSDDYIAGRG